MSDKITGKVTQAQTVRGTLAMAETIGGVKDYNRLDNHPYIEGEELIGDKTLLELHIDRYLPVEVSQLYNDSGYQTADEVAQKVENSIPENVSAFNNDVGYLTEADVETKITEEIDKIEIPTNVSDLNNDADYQTGAEVTQTVSDAIGALSIPSKTSDLTNDSGFQTAAEVLDAVSDAIADANIPTKLSDLTNDMTFQTLTQITALINDAVGDITGIDFEVVDSLPASGEKGIIYLVPNGSSLTPNVYDEYIYYNNAWELIGSTQIDLSNYVQKSEMVPITNDQIDALFTTPEPEPEPEPDPTSDATATADDILYPKTAYAKGEKLTGTIATPDISSTTLFRNSITLPKGYYPYGVSLIPYRNNKGNISITKIATLNVTIGEKVSVEDITGADSDVCCFKFKNTTGLDLDLQALPMTYYYGNATNNKWDNNYICKNGDYFSYIFNWNKMTDFKIELYHSYSSIYPEYAGKTLQVELYKASIY